MTNQFADFMKSHFGFGDPFIHELFSMRGSLNLLAIVKKREYTLHRFLFYIDIFLPVLKNRSLNCDESETRGFATLKNSIRKTADNYSFSLFLLSESVNEYKSYFGYMFWKLASDHSHLDLLLAFFGRF